MSRICKFYILIVGCCLCVLRSYGQQYPAFVHYWDVEPQYNPAAAGRSDQLTINAAYQTHATGYQDAGGTMYAGADMAFQLGKVRQGVGAIFQNDEIGLFSHKRFSLQYSYHVPLWGGRFSIGVEGDMLSESLKGSKAVLEKTNDPAFPNTDITGSKFDASLGVYYNHRLWYAGISVQHLTEPTVWLGEINQFRYKRLYNFTAGYNIKLKNTFITIVPSTMLRYSGVDFRADITTRLEYSYEKKQLYAGVGYAPGHAVTAFVGGVLYGVEVGYAYEANIRGMGLGAGIHELMLSYKLPIRLKKKGKNIHKSVRFL